MLYVPIIIQLASDQFNNGPQPHILFGDSSHELHDDVLSTPTRSCYLAYTTFAFTKQFFTYL